MQIFRKINVYIISSFVAAAVFLVSGTAALAVEDEMFTPSDTGTYAPSQIFTYHVSAADSDAAPLGNWCDGWGVSNLGAVEISDVAGYGNGTVYGSKGSFACHGDDVTFQLPVGSYSTLWFNCDSGGGMCPPEGVGWSGGNHQMTVSLDIQGALTPGQQSTAAIQSSGESVLMMFFAALPSILAVAIAVALTLWAIGWMKKKIA